MPESELLAQVEQMIRETGGITLTEIRGGFYAYTLEIGGGEREWGSGQTLAEALTNLYEAFNRPAEE